MIWSPVWGKVWSAPCSRTWAKPSLSKSFDNFVWCSCNNLLSCGGRPSLVESRSGPVSFEQVPITPHAHQTSWNITTWNIYHEGLHLKRHCGTQSMPAAHCNHYDISPSAVWVTLLLTTHHNLWHKCGAVASWHRSAVSLPYSLIMHTNCCYQCMSVWLLCEHQILRQKVTSGSKRC